MRSMSFALTTPQIGNRTKTVTRRLGWEWLQPGDLIRAVVKGMGLRKGESPVELAILRVVSVTREPLRNIRHELDGTAREGFPEMLASEFVAMFCDHMSCGPDERVTRIEFRYVPGGRL